MEDLRPELERQIATVVDRFKWQPQDINLLTTHYENLKDAKSTHADSIKTKIPISQTDRKFLENLIYNNALEKRHIT
ncbi:MAG: hypothetical protein F6K25_07250 [Okeania sp. SIO2G4]|uniref:hypothetical protein n=1 Tax=unclassified Okeania TaxID=2634635 RepID=UPI0013BD1376|nr:MULTISPECIES: hypothetical protein [unclassified Okeania]NEP07778.1 hypothetical protein [Okeania sp. SIO4D6]NEP44502.1 hypothetical protein [Okeania sp. SIO2H7]NEP72246.1 hypothetical protein [Okeania sp. SIO2G5]NEP94607.1 hypothetical protein [Okeania sp. SIO2F5]NEQ90525.1 hypothetical protein [Okeania sp. SIO2G4]